MQRTALRSFFVPLFSNLDSKIYVGLTREQRRIHIMAEYEGNGDFNYNADGSSDFKRDFKRDGGASVKSDDENEEGAQVPEKVNEYIRELMAEKQNIDHKYPQAEKLIDAGELIVIPSNRPNILHSPIH